MDRNSSRITKIALGVTLALTGAQVGLSSSATALTLLDSSEADAPSLIATSKTYSNGYAESAMTDRMIIKYREAASQTMTALEASDHIETLSRATNIKMQFVRTTGNQAQVVQLEEAKPLGEVQAIAEEVAKNPNVLYAEPDRIMQPYAAATDPRYNEQWHYFEPAGGINLPKAWDASTGKGVVVAVIDTGIRPHVDLAEQILPGYDFITDSAMANDGDGRDSDPIDPGNWVQAGECGNGQPEEDRPSSWHGTHVAGTIAAKTNNDLGGSGVAWEAKILPVRVLGKCGGYMSDIADGMRWAAGAAVTGVPDNPNPAQVLNLSLGGPGACSQTETEAIEAVRAQGASVVVAAGNSNQDASQYSPANCPDVITVAATNRDGGRAYYSNFGTIVDVAAPGGQMNTSTDSDGVLSTLNAGQTTPGTDDYYGFYQGTSMAAPHVAGVAALVYAVKPDLTPDQMEALLKQTARAFPTVDERPCDTNQCGAGIVDAFKAVNVDTPDPDPGTFENTTDVNIPDNDVLGATSMINVTRNGDSGIIKVEVDIKHPNASELYVKLSAPDGAYAVLEDSSATGANIQKSYRLDATGHAAQGQWSLLAVDKESGNTGYIDAWRITFE
jgi:serine protease